MKDRIVTPELILHHICREQERIAKDRTYIIMGRTGPTGKTWLCGQLNNRGFKAIELSEHVYDLVDYPTDRNHYRICGDVGIVVLNQTLPWFETVKGE